MKNRRFLYIGLLFIAGAIAFLCVEAGGANYSVQRILNTVLVDDSVSAIVSEQYAFNAVYDDANAALRIRVTGELRGGVSTYQVSGDMVLGAAHVDGRIGELAAAASPVIELPALSGVTPAVILTDLTTEGMDSGVTIWSPHDIVLSGVGANFKTGETVFVNSGNTGFTINLKATSRGWKVMACDADEIRAP